MIAITTAGSPEDVAAVRGLFAEYIDSLGVDVSFQGVGAELAELPGRYAPPSGAMLIARDGAGEAVGCVALRALPDPGLCEIKRLYVRPQARGQDLGRRLAQAILSCAKDAGYAQVRLDTLASMQPAQKLYASLGFRPIAPYYDNPLPEAVYMALDLADATPGYVSSR